MSDWHGLTALCHYRARHSRFIRAYPSTSLGFCEGVRLPLGLSPRTPRTPHFWGQGLITMHYNPFASALSAAAAELSSSKAQRYYSIRAQQDLQTAFILILQLGCFAIALCAWCRQWVEDFERSARVSFEHIPFESRNPLAVTGSTSWLKLQYVGHIPAVRVVAIASIPPAALPGYQPIAILNPSNDHQITKGTRAKSSAQATKRLTKQARHKA
jgi:hypothetical protein